MTTLIGYARVSKADASQVHDLQRDALTRAGVKPAHIYQDSASAVSALTGFIALISVGRRLTGELEIDKETADELAEDAPDLIPL